MDYAAVITDLEEKRGAIDQVLAGFQRLIGAPHGNGHRAPKQLTRGGGQREAQKRAARPGGAGLSS